MSPEPDMDPSLYSHLNKQWQSTCKILLGDSVGDLDDYVKWLYEGNGPRLVKKSNVSGKDIFCASTNYSADSNFIGYDEVDFDGKREPESSGSLNINEVKDIDSIFSALAERISYTGNIILGNSSFVAQSTTITECHYVLHSERAAFSKNVAYSTRGSYSENIFGCHAFGPASFSIKSNEVSESTRCFMTSKADFSSDCFYSHGLSSCMECMFSFNLKSKRYVIGNLQLPKDKYLAFKAKLLAEIRERLKKDKRLPFITELVGNEKPNYSVLKATAQKLPAAPQEKTDKSGIEKAFSQATRILFGKSLAGKMDDYAQWLSDASSIRLDKEKSCASGKPLLLPDLAGFLDFPRDRLLMQDEAYFFGDALVLNESEVESLSLENAGKILSKIAYFCPFWLAGKLQNNIDCPLVIDASDCYHGIQNMWSRLCAFSFCPRNSEYCFGCREVRYALFSMNSHFSTRITRCFEVDHSNNCTDCFFCHNCENVHESMFCFNTRNKRFAIGNVEVGKEKYMAAKKVLLSWIIATIEKKKKLPVSIFNFSRNQK